MARILIVDDSPSQLLGMKRIVEKLGHETVTAEDGAAGVEVGKSTMPDLILMDVVMPNLNGFQATRAIPRSRARAHPGRAGHHQGPGDRQGLGHAPGRQGLHHQALHREPADRSDQHPARRRLSSKPDSKGRRGVPFSICAKASPSCA
jgi:hypothetical protein